MGKPREFWIGASISGWNAIECRGAYEGICPNPESSIHVIEKSVYDEAQTKIAELESKLAELDELNTQTCVQRDIASERVDELKAKLEVARAALQFYAGYAGYDFNKALTALKQIEEE